MSYLLQKTSQRRKESFDTAVMDFKVIVAVAVFLSSFDLAQAKYPLRQEGDYIIGQLLSLRKDSGREKCAVLDLEKLIEVEALVYSAKKLNAENAKLRVGYDIIDACANSSEAKLDFATETWFKKGGNISRVPVAIITDLDENNYIAMATKVQRFTKRVENSGNGLPLISVKNNLHIWPNTYSLSASKESPHRAILELVKHFQWNIVDVVIQGYHREFHEFKKMAGKNDICLLNELFVSNSDSLEATPWLRKGKSNASVVVVFASELPRFMTTLDRYTSRSRSFILGSAMPGTQVLSEASMEGVLGIQRDFGDLIDFEKHLESSELLDTWIAKSICLNVSLQNCDLSGLKKEAIKKSSWHGAAIIDAVYAIVGALRKSGIHGRLPKTGLAGIEVLSATDRAVSFDKDGNLDNVIYKVVNFQKTDDVRAVEVGAIEVSEKIKLSFRNDTRIVWRGLSRPRSRCSAECPPGTRQKPLDAPLSKCCWDCIRCEPGFVSSFANSSRCVECPADSKPTADRTKCQPPYFDYLRWHEPFSLIMIFLLAFTICFLVYTVNLYVKKANTPVFTRSKCASLPLLLSLFVTFLLPVLLLMKPTRSSCGAYNAIFVFSQGAPLTFLIARSHFLHNYCYTEAGQLKRKWLCFNPQTAVGCALIIFQLVFVVVYLSVAPAKVLVFDTTAPDVQYLECSSHSRPEFLPLVFFILALVMAFNILHMNETSSSHDFNEVKFVSLTFFFVYAILFVYFVAVFGLDGKKKKIMIMCAMSYLLGINFFVAIFLPKVYVILFRSEKNLPDQAPLLRDDEENGRPSRMVSPGCSDSPSPGLLSSGQYDRTEV